MLRIAIDGPGGAGKSSLAKEIARKLGIIYVDTGALYRTIGLYMVKNGISPSDPERVTAALGDFTLELTQKDGKQIILLNGEDVGDSIRTPEMSMAASAVSAIGSVREFLLGTQRDIAEKNDVIMDGRDIGTVILPDAEVKIFLTASPEARAKRRFDELTAKGLQVSYDQVYAEMVERDKNDSTREIAPCVPASDAVLFDNSELDAEGTVKAALKIINKKVKMRKRRGHPFYMFCRAIVLPFYRLFARVHVTGLENVPSDKAPIICCNHIGVNDIFVLGTVYPRQIHFLAKKEWFSVPVLKNIMRVFGAIELDRGGKDVGALKNAVTALKENKTVTIFPQGHRYPGVNPAETPVKSGLGFLAYHSKAPVLPVCIKTKDVKFKFLRRIDLIIGKPLSYSDLGFENGGYDEYKNATEKAFAKTCSLGGYYALPSGGENAEEKA